MLLGDWQLDTISGGRFRLDGGAMFGVVPKPLWEKVQPADARNRIQLNTNCVLARDGDHNVLIDTGYGGKATAREREQMELAEGEPLVESLAAVGVDPADIDLVVFSHAHFDHAGGGTRYDLQGKAVPTFPNATYVFGRWEWEDATSGVAELAGSYPLENLLPVEECGQLRLVDDGETIVPGITAQRTGGHTRGHQVLRLESCGEVAVYTGDICPTHAHLHSKWCMGYDTHLLDTRRIKPELFGRAADEGWLILWDHDPDMAAARIARDERREFVVAESIDSLS